MNQGCLAYVSQVSSYQGVILIILTTLRVKSDRSGVCGEVQCWSISCLKYGAHFSRYKPTFSVNMSLDLPNIIRLQSTYAIMAPLTENPIFRLMEFLRNPNEISTRILKAKKMVQLKDRCVVPNSTISTLHMESEVQIALLAGMDAKSRHELPFEDVVKFQA